MSTDLLTDLERLGDLLERMSNPIVVDDIADREPSSLGDWQAFESDESPVVAIHDRRPSSVRSWRTATAIVTAAAVVGALWIVASRPGTDPDADEAPDATAANGHMTLDSLPAGWRFEMATDSVYSDTDGFLIERVYSTAGPAPEALPALLLSSIGADVGEPVVGAGAEAVEVQGVSARVFSSDGGGQSLVFGPLQGQNYRLVGYHVSRDELVAAANTVHPSADGYGAVIDDAALPAGVSERGAGFVSELWFISKQAAANPIPQAHWTDGTGALWYRSFEDPDMLPLGRFGFDTVTDTTVNGHPAIVATVAVDPLSAGSTAQGSPVASVTWSDGARTYLLASNSIDSQQLQSLAASLRPASDDEWAQLTDASSTVQSSTPTTTIVGPEGTEVPSVTTALLSERSLPGHALIEPPTDWNVLFQQAYQIEVERCMTQLGFEYVRRPLEGSSASDVAAMTEWESWRDGKFASTSGYQDALYGTDAEADPGCQLGAFPAVFGGQVRSDQIAANLESSMSGEWLRTARTDPRLSDGIAAVSQCLDQAGYPVTAERDVWETAKQFENGTGSSLVEACPADQQLELDVRVIADEFEQQWFADNGPALAEIQARYAADIARFKAVIAADTAAVSNP
jgi:hypothetical protein